jgi:hypothetical protein
MQCCSKIPMFQRNLLPFSLWSGLCCGLTSLWWWRQQCLLKHQYPTQHYTVSQPRRRLQFSTAVTSQSSLESSGSHS